MAILPATGSAMTFTNVKKGYSNAAPGGGSNVALRGTLGAYLSISSGAVSLSSTFGGRSTPHAT